MKKILSFFLLLFFLTSCGSVGNISKKYDRSTTNYEFLMDVYKRKDELYCFKIKLKVRPRSKLYLDHKPPSKVELIDKDCRKPFDWEKIEVRKNDRTKKVYVGSKIANFFSKYEKMELEISKFLFEKGITKNSGPLK